MKRSLALILGVLLLTTGLAFSANHADQDQHLSCSYCGMNRVKFAHSRMLIEYQDGSSVGTCSIHCAAIEFANSIDKVPARIMVGDFASKELIDAQSATWVIGGKKPGVMTTRPKWAFADKSAAEAFIGKNGGEIIGFEEAMEAAYTDMYKDTLKIRKKRKMMKMSHKHN